MTDLFHSLLGQIQDNGENTRKWVNAAKNYFAEFIHTHEILRTMDDSVTIVLHGSTSRNIDDPHSDLDFWLVLDDSEHEKFRSITEQSMIEVEIGGKPGHINPLRLRELEACFSHRINMVLANEVSSSIVIEDRKNVFNRFIALSNRPLSEAVKYAFFFHNYVEMRCYNRCCDNPMERNDSFAVLYNVMSTIRYMFQAAFVLDNTTYPYEKWLYVFAGRSEAPKSLIENVDNIIEEIVTNPFSLFGPEKDNKISHELAIIRKKLIEKAKQEGIDEIWLEKWWLYIDKARNIVNDVCWADQ